MAGRNRHLARQLRAALRASRWSADTHVLRLHLSRSTMARVLVGDEEVSLRIYQLVAEALELSVEFLPYQQPAEPLPGAVETVVDEAVKRLRARAGGRIPEQTWDSFFQGGPRVSDDFLPRQTNRAS